MKGATGPVLACEQVYRYFNPRSREGSDGLEQPMKFTRDISIHAPVKGATSRHGFEPRRVHISIHAPVKGATGLDRVLPVSMQISIHAPVKGATGGVVFGVDSQTISIHAPVKGATSVAHPRLILRQFQSTLP